MSQAEVDSCPEGQMPVGPPFEVEAFGMLVGIRVHVGRCQHGHDLFALLHPHPAEVHVLAFGDLFESYSTSPQKPAALRYLAAVQIDGNTSPTPAGSWDTDSLDYDAYFLNLEPYKLITGPYNTRIENIREALEPIMQGGVNLALIQ